MRSLIIEIARPGSTNNYVLNKDTKYLSMCGANPEVTFSIDCDQYDFIKMINGLRYDDADPDSSSVAISFFQNLATKLFEDLKYLKMQPGDSEPLHVRLTTTPFELAQLPFEFVLTPANISGQSKIPLLANPERIITLTREIRQETDVKYVWPFKPRILFVWSEPNKEMTVPHEEHMAVLKTLVKSFAKPFPDRPDPEPDTTEFLTELPNASLDSIRRELQQAIGNAKPYTHVHILAHGGTADVFGVHEFRIILCKDGTTDVVQKAKGESLAKAIVSDDPENNPAVVSLAVCDSGQAGNTILPTGSLVYQLHLSGIPCVFASQFPLTQPGSVKLVEVLFHELIHACDPRLALYKARLELKKESTHDWASLVAYARFPGDINEQLQAVSLKMHFNSMRITNAWVDHVFKYWDEIDEGKKEPALQDLDSRLTTSINGLVSYLDKGDKNKSNLANALLQAEHLGLLASAYKRQAEYLFRLGKVNPGKKLSVEADSLKALENAKQFYDCGRKANPAAHWNSMQYLSLKAITEGTLTGDEGLWHVVKYMAQSDEENAGNEFDKIWAWGTLAELYLLKPLTKPGGMLKEEIELSIPVAKDYLKKMAATDSKYNSAKESTTRQFERYISWWPDLPGLRFPMWLKDTAKDVRDVFPSLAELSEVN